MLTWAQRARLDTLAPETLTTPAGNRRRLDYLGGPEPILPVPVQELFGTRDTPSIADGRVPVMLHLLSPAGRPVQISRDLAGFWARGYPQIPQGTAGALPQTRLAGRPARRGTGHEDTRSAGLIAAAVGPEVTPVATGPRSGLPADLATAPSGQYPYLPTSETVIPRSAMRLFRWLTVILGLVLAEVAYAQSAVAALEQGLIRIDRFIAETQVELQVALSGYDQAAIVAAGDRIRDLKRRRERIAKELAVEAEQQRQHEAGALRRLRPELMRRLEAIEPQVDKRRPPSTKSGRRRGGALRALTVEEIDLRAIWRRPTRRHRREVPRMRVTMRLPPTTGTKP